MNRELWIKEIWGKLENAEPVDCGECVCIDCALGEHCEISDCQWNCYNEAGNLTLQLIFCSEFQPEGSR